MTADLSAVAPTVLAVCVVHADIDVPGRSGRSAIDKRPVPQARVEALGLVDDHVCDTKNHGGPNQAVYAYAEEDAQRWGAELGRELPAGWFGENLRVQGVPVSDAVVGTRWRIGDVLLEVTAPRVPCLNFAFWSGEDRWVKRFAERGDTGTYFRVLAPGTVAAGTAIDVAYTPAHGVTVRELFERQDAERMARLLAAEPTLTDEARNWAELVVGREEARE